jgi:hypothetical protein
MQSVLSARREAYRNQIRHQELEEYFAQKRKLMSCSYGMEIEQHSFRMAVPTLLEGSNQQESLAILSGLSFNKQLWEEFEDLKQAEQLYEELIEHLLQIVERHSAFSQQDSA